MSARSHEGKIALITGASSGIGREMARQLAARGCDLVLVSRNEDELARLAAALRSEHDVSVHVAAVDLAVPGAGARLAAFAREKGLSVDFLVNNAGVGIYGEHVETDLESVQKMLQLNVVAVSDLCGLFGKEMRVRGAGKILNVASTAGYQPAPYFAAYGASKSWVLNFSEALAKELEDYGVSVSCLSPGPTDTPFFSGMDASGVENGHFDKGDRADASAVAAAGIALMLDGGLSKIVGTKNYFRAWSARFASRRMVASIAKSLLAPKTRAAG